MPSPLDDVRLTSLPRSALAALASLRRDSGVAVAVEDQRAWVRWEPGAEEVLRRVLPLEGAELFSRREGHWYRVGSYLPTPGIPDDSAFVKLARAVLPAHFEAEPAQSAGWEPVRLRLVRDDHPRGTTALRCGWDELGRWADSATTAQLVAIQGARLGESVLLLGQSLPVLTGSERFWGGRVLAPLGFRFEPGLPGPALLGARGVGEGEILLLTTDQAEVIPKGVFAPLERASIRLALEERS